MDIDPGENPAVGIMLVALGVSTPIWLALEGVYYLAVTYVFILMV